MSSDRDDYGGHAWTVSCVHCGSSVSMKELLAEAMVAHGFPDRIVFKSNTDFTVYCGSDCRDLADVDAALETGDLDAALTRMCNLSAAGLLSDSHLDRIAQWLETSATLPPATVSLVLRVAKRVRAQSRRYDDVIFQRVVWSTLDKYALDDWFYILETALERKKWHATSAPALVDMLGSRPVGVGADTSSVHARCVKFLLTLTSTAAVWNKTTALGSDLGRAMAAVADAVLGMLESCETRGPGRATLVANALLVVGNICWGMGDGATPLRLRARPVMEYVLTSLDGVSRNVANAILWAAGTGDWNSICRQTLPDDPTLLAKHVLAVCGTK